MNDKTFGGRFGLVAAIPAPIGAAWILSGTADIQQGIETAGVVRLSLAAISVLAGMVFFFWIAHRMGSLITRRSSSEGALLSLAWGALTGVLMALAFGISIGLPVFLITGEPMSLLAGMVLGLLGLWIFLPYGVVMGGLLRVVGLWLFY